MHRLAESLVEHMVLDQQLVVLHFVEKRETQHVVTAADLKVLQSEVLINHRLKLGLGYSSSFLIEYLLALDL